MGELVGMSYKSLVERAYITPIRSVVVVDDDFPTLDQLLKSAVEPPIGNSPNPIDTIQVSTTEAAGSQPHDIGRSELQFRFTGSRREVKRASDLISACRSRTPPWTVDIHDGSPNDGVDEVVLAPTLHHSDLMILDYHLNGDSGDGKRAIDILRALAKNGQFNLVVVFTKGIGNSLQPVFEQILTGLLHDKDGSNLPTGKLDAIRELIGEWEEEDGVDISEKLTDLVSTSSYLRERSGEDVFVSEELSETVFEPLLLRCPKNILDKDLRFELNGVEQRTKVTARDLFDFGLSLRHVELAPLQSNIDLGNISSRYDGNANWLRLDQLFVTIVNKADATPSDLVDRLTGALMDWGPGPHQLLMTNMRNQLGENGVLAEAAVLADEPLQAGWLHQLLSQADARSVMLQSVSRHWDALGESVFSGVSEYGRELINHFRSLDQAAVFAKHSRPEFEKNQRLAHLNHYYSSRSIDSSHLTTGHILELENILDNGDRSHEYWVCLSPACDLVPGQKKNGWRSRLGEAIPFIGVHLTKEPDIAKALKDINHNRHIFIKDDTGNIVSLVFTGSQSTSMPVWEHMFALNSGNMRISASATGSWTLAVQRMKAAPGQLDPEPNGRMEAQDAAGKVAAAPPPAGLSFINCKARVVSQLRYEYALNLLQRLGSSLTRVGLDFQAS